MSADGKGLVAVAFPVDRGEAQMIQALLERSGIPSILRQQGVDGPTVGFGLLNPDGGPHRVLVHAERMEEARALLDKALEGGEREVSAENVDEGYLEEPEGRRPRSYGLIGGYARIYAVSLVAMAVMFAVFLLFRAL